MDNLVSRFEPDVGYQQSALYVDSPMAGSINQFYPFFQSGFFDPKETRILLRKHRVGGPDFGRAPDLEHLARYKEGQLPSLKLRESVLFYTFNSKSNVSMMANRSVIHALILHGESNKISSCRPMARMYDFVCISGQAARDRYLSNRIFTRDEIDRGRLIMTGDTFVQTIHTIRKATDADGDPWILYAPTWENGSIIENYSSAEGGYGFDVAMRAAGILGCRKVAIKLHPNFGKKDRGLIGILQGKIKSMLSAGFEVRLLEPQLDRWTALVFRAKFGSSLFQESGEKLPIRMAVIDISGMEAICLKQDIPHLVITKPNTLISATSDIVNSVYPWKTLELGSPLKTVEKILHNRTQFADLDKNHRHMVFGYSIDGYEKLTDRERNFSLVKHMNESDYWAK